MCVCVADLRSVFFSSLRSDKRACMRGLVCLLRAQVGVPQREAPLRGAGIAVFASVA